MTESLSSQVRQTIQRILPTVTVAGVLYGVLIGCLCALVPGSWALAEGWYAIDDSVNVVITGMVQIEA